jgi:tRNA 2-selenouridine synthase
LQNTADYEALFLNDTPMMDVRAPVEFTKGAFPCADSRPLMTDEERTLVGTCYKEKGQDSAIELGHELVKGDIKEQRLETWKAFHAQHPNGLLYCFRGGLRSRLTQQALMEAGIDMPFVIGGYKAMRTFLLQQLQQRIAQGNALILSGPTGSGKTEVIHDWKNSIDLEGLANHRGSAFGRTETEQPSQINFENAWSIEWLKRIQTSNAPVLFEDESRLIGRIAVVPEFLALSKTANLVVLKAPVEERIERIRKDYVIRAYESQLSNGTEQAEIYLDDFVRSALTRIKKRLGGERYKTLIATLDDAMIGVKSQNSWQGFDAIIETLLIDYYDPMYTYQFSCKENNKLFEGSHSEILEWLTHKTP